MIEPTAITIELSKCVEAFEAMGFEKIEGSPRHHSLDRFYRHARSTQVVEYFAALDYKPKAKTFGLSLGVSSPTAMSILRHNLPTVLKYAHPSISVSGLLQRPCWMMFSAGRALRWDYMAIPAPIDRVHWPAQLREVETRLLEPTFFSITHPAGILDLLLRDDDPLLWWAATSAVLRTAEIVALSRPAGVDIGSVREKLAPFETRMEKEMEGVKDAQLMISEFSRAFLVSH